MLLVHGESPFLEDCILSLLNQSLCSSVIIVTSTSYEFVDKIIRKYQIPVIYNQDSSGIAADWNSALKHCPTRYCTLANQDDIYLPDYLLECSRKISSSFSIMFTDYQDMDAQGNQIAVSETLIKKLMLLPFIIKNEIHSRQIRKFVFRFGNPVGCPGVLYDRSNVAG